MSKGGTGKTDKKKAQIFGTPEIPGQVFFPSETGVRIMKMTVPLQAGLMSSYK